MPVPFNKLELSDGTTILGVSLLKGKEGNDLWRKYRAPVTVPRRAQGALRYTDKPPEQELILPIDSLHLGAGQDKYNPGDPASLYRYDSAEGVEVRFADIIGMGPKRNYATLFLRNGDFESSTVDSGWTKNNCTTAAVTTSLASNLPPDSVQAVEVTATAGGASAKLEQAIMRAAANPYSGSATFTVGAYVKSSTANSARVMIYTTGPEYSSYHTGGGAWEWLSKDVTTNLGGALKVSLVLDNDTDVAQLDYFQILPSGGVTALTGIHEFAGEVYASTGHCLLRYVTTSGDNYWKWDYFADNPITGIGSYQGNIYIGHGQAAGYEYSADPTAASPTWTTSVIAGDSKYADFFLTVRNTLWKAIVTDGSDDNALASAVDPLTGGSWNAETTVGDRDREITAVYPSMDTIFVGREDGLWTYRRYAEETGGTDAWRNLVTEFDRTPDADNFKHGVEFKGNLYLTAGNQGFMRFDGTTMQPLEHIFSGSTSSAGGGNIRAICPGFEFLYGAVDTPTAAATQTKDTWIWAFRDVFDSALGITRFAGHSLNKVRMSDSPMLFAFGDKLHIVGRLYNADQTDYHGIGYFLDLPTQHANPILDLTPSLTKSAVLITSWMDWGNAITPKAFLSIDLQGANIDTNRNVKVEFEKDDSGSWVTFATFTAVGTKYFKTEVGTAANRNGKKIRFKITLTSNVNTSGPQPRLFVKAILRPVRLSMFDFTVNAADGVLGEKGQQKVTAETVITQLDTWVDTANPLTLKKWRENNAVQTWNVVLVEPDEAEIGQEIGRNAQYAYRVLCQEVKAA